MKKLFTLVIVAFYTFQLNAQLPDSCKLQFGTNLAGISDWGTEMPFVDMMHYSRIWYTKDVDNPSAAWNSELADQLTYRTDGYPTQIPQTVSGSSFQQKVATIWGSTNGWEAGDYVVLFDGTGTLSFGGGYSSLAHPSSNRYTFSFLSPMDNIFELVIETSAAADPVRNIRIIKSEYESTYATEPFNPTWLEKLSMFKSVRFMDWGQTNNWNQDQPWDWDDTTRYDWSDRAKFDYYTWTTKKGVPYEMMVKLMNDYDIDGWVCVPHTASDNYIQNMAQYFKDNLETERKLTVEYSNETWNWMFGQAQWLNEFGCVATGTPWPEGTVPYIQNCMDIWTTVWSSDLDRLTRAVGIQTGWLDVAQRTAFNMTSSSYDAIAATYYFGLNDSADAILDGLGASATVGQLASLVRNTLGESETYIENIKNEVADSMNKKMVFYEGGQHITPIPFGDEPTYADALLAIQRDTSMYNLYNEWFDFLRTIQEGDEPLQLMNFSFIADRSARYGSWGLLETQYQDTAVIPAPKYQAVAENQNMGCIDDPTNIESLENIPSINYYPNPSNGLLNIHSSAIISTIQVYDLLGKKVLEKECNNAIIYLNAANLTSGIYIVKVRHKDVIAPITFKWVKEG